MIISDAESLKIRNFSYLSEVNAFCFGLRQIVNKARGATQPHLLLAIFYLRAILANLR